MVLTRNLVGRRGFSFESDEAYMDRIPRDNPDLSEGEDSESDQVRLVSEIFVARVSVFAEDGENGKPQFSTILDLDECLNPSNRLRRTETVTSLALECEEKELPGLARLAGRRLRISRLRKKSEIQLESVLSENQLLKDEIQRLTQKNSKLAEQLQFSIDSQRNS